MDTIISKVEGGTMIFTSLGVGLSLSSAVCWFVNLIIDHAGVSLFGIKGIILCTLLVILAVAILILLYVSAMIKLTKLFRWLNVEYAILESIKHLSLEPFRCNRIPDHSGKLPAMFKLFLLTFFVAGIIPTDSAVGYNLFLSALAMLALGVVFTIMLTIVAIVLTNKRQKRDNQLILVYRESDYDDEDDDGYWYDDEDDWDEDEEFDDAEDELEEEICEVKLFLPAREVARRYR